MNLSIKIKILESCILPGLTYGTQSCVLTEKLIQWMTQNAMLRRVLGIRLKAKVSVKLIRKGIGTKNERYKIKTPKLRYAGHMISGICYAHAGPKCTVHSLSPKEPKKKKNRPVRRWVDKIVTSLGPDWMHTSRNRDSWRRVTEAYTLQWTDLVATYLCRGYPNGVPTKYCQIKKICDTDSPCQTINK